jgi:hypothetical protein
MVQPTNNEVGKDKMRATIRARWSAWFVSVKTTTRVIIVG